MNRIQKISWLLVITISLGLITSGIAILIAAYQVGFPKAFDGLAFLGIAGFGGLGPLIFRKDKGKVTCDERDREINRKAALTGFAMSYLFVGLVCMIPFSILKPNAAISVRWLPMIFAGAGLTSFFFHSVAILVQYGFGGKDGKD